MLRQPTARLRHRVPIISVMLAGIYAVGQQELAAWQQCQALSWVLTGISMLLSGRGNSVATEAVVRVIGIR